MKRTSSQRYLLLLITVLLVWFSGGVLLTAQDATPSTCNEVVGRVERPDYRSTLVDTSMVYSIYLPPCYDQTTQRYPTIYLLHGSNDDDHHWLRLGLKELLDERITTGKMPPVIVVLPFGNWIANENQFGMYSWENVFFSEMMPLVEAKYRVDLNRANRAIGGISRGGFWAFQIGLLHGDLFSTIGGHSGFFDRFHAPPDYNPLDLVLKLTPETAPRIAIDRGALDYAAPGLDIMDERLKAAGIPYTYTIYPEGEHNNLYWQEHIPEYLDFYVQPWLNTQPLPTSTPLGVESVAFITNTPRPTLNVASGSYVILPAVVFPSLKGSLSRNTLLQVIQGGELDRQLVVGESVAATLAAQGITLNALTMIVPDSDVYKSLSSDRNRWTLLPFDRLNTRYRMLWLDEKNPLDDLNNYPLAFGSDQPNFDPSKLTRILTSGVTALTRRSMPVFDEKGMVWASEAIAPLTRSVDFFHTSNEVSFVEGCPQTPPGVTLLGGFCSKPEYFEVLTLLGVDIVELSGNHNNDYGYEAYNTTLDWYQRKEIRTVGGGATLADARDPLILDHNGNRIAWVSCNWVGPYYALVNEDPAGLGGIRPGAAGCDRDWLAATIPQLKVEYGTVIVSVQYLESDSYTPLSQQRLDFAWLAGLGADVVLGTQAHWPQTYEYAPKSGGGEALLHYGLGNFIFDQPWWANSRFFMDELYIYDDKLQFVQLYTGIIEELGRPRLMTPAERDEFLYLMFVKYAG